MLIQQSGGRKSPRYVTQQLQKGGQFPVPGIIFLLFIRELLVPPTCKLHLFHFYGCFPILVIAVVHRCCTIAQSPKSSHSSTGTMSFYHVQCCNFSVCISLGLLSFTKTIATEKGIFIFMQYFQHVKYCLENRARKTEEGWIFFGD